jgi:hypothetical protein
MRVLKILGSALISCAALFAFTVSAQTQNVPVSCNWVQTGSQAGQSAAIITFQCKEANNNVAATRSLTYTAPSWQVTNCSISLASGVYNSGTCQSANLYRVEQVVTPNCNSGAYIGAGCANSMTASPGFGAAVQQVCGTGCPVRFENLGATNGCYRESPYLKAYCL